MSISKLFVPGITASPFHSQLKWMTTHPVYQWLTQKALNGVHDSEVTWNFQKYALDEQGQLVRVFPPATSPLDEALLEWLNQ